jgi:hypothetical protein
MTDTPRTDALIDAISKWDDTEQADEFCILCEKLERELNAAKAEVEALKRRLGQHDACNGVMGESGYVPECISMRAERDEARAELARLTTLRTIKTAPVTGYLSWNKSVSGAWKWTHPNYATHWTPLPDVKEADK